MQLAPALRNCLPLRQRELLLRALQEMRTCKKNVILVAVVVVVAAVAAAAAAAAAAVVGVVRDEN